MPIDPVCKMLVNIGKEKASYKGRGYFFCSSECKKKFMETPEAFAK
ncbi:MAG: YHS domain-containing protein [Candidatus Aenigmarchaeota archaeon]|nr:YHS domain-containing protein [Candidatus Aenigmarchaeota archaeon]